MGLRSLRAAIERLERARRGAGPGPGSADRLRFAWYADGCPCGVPPGECREHPRARPGQRPPAEDWRVFLLLGGRGAGKTRTAAELVRHWVETGQSRRIGLIGATAADVRDTMIQGPSGILSISPPWSLPRFEPSKRRLSWPNGAIAICLSSEEPERARGLQFDRLWADELCAWQYPQRMWELALLGLRMGTRPQAVVTTTPKPIGILRRLLAEPTTRLSRETTFANQLHLAPEFIEQITALYAGSRLGRQELLAEIVEASEAIRFPMFDAARHVTTRAEYVPGLPVKVAIDCGLSRHVGALWFQVRERDAHRRILGVFADYYAVDQTSEVNARAILARSRELCHGRLDAVYLDPASTARSGVGPAARGEFARVLGERLTTTWPSHRVLEGLDQVEILLGGPDREPDLIIHPRCTFLIESFRTYRRAERRGEVLDVPADPQHPAEEALDSLRGAVRVVYPEGRAPTPQLRTVHAGGLC
jgi:phage terminase large subunit-like protein